MKHKDQAARSEQRARERWARRLAEARGPHADPRPTKRKADKRGKPRPAL